MELLVIITIIGILAVGVVANFSGSQAQARDAQRQTELRELELAIENYRRDNRRYPEGCNGTGWSGQIGSEYVCSSFCSGLQEDAYICDLMPQYINEVSVDVRAPDGSIGGYMYITNESRTAFKLVAPVESGATTMTPCPDYCNCENNDVMAVWGGFTTGDSDDFACTIPIVAIEDSGPGPEQPVHPGHFK